MKINKTTVIIIALVSLALILLPLVFMPRSTGFALAYALGSIITAGILAGIVGTIAYFVGKRSSQAANVAISVAFVMCLATQLSSVVQGKILSPQDRLQQMVEAANKGLPKKIDEVTEFRAITYDRTANSMTYDYVITDPGFAVTDEVANNLKKIAEKAFADNTSPIKTVIDESAASVYWTYTQKGKEVAKIKVK